MIICNTNNYLCHRKNNKYMKKILLIIICAILCGRLSAFSTLTGEYKISKNDSIYLSFVEQADSAIAHEDWANAELSLLSAMRSAPANPTNVMLLSNLAIVQFHQGKDSVALASINDACNIAPRSITVLSHRARIHKAMGHIDDAYTDYQLILDIDSTLIEPRYMHGIIALSKYDFKVAQRDFDVLVRLDPNNELTIDAMATYLFYTQQYEQAASYYTRMLKIKPTEEAYYHRATCYLILEKLPEAATDIADAMKLYPLNGEFYLLRAWLNRLYYRHNDAEADARRAIELGVPATQVKALLELPLHHE